MVVKAVARQTAEGLEDQTGKQVAILFPDLADLMGGLEGFVIPGVSDVGENDLAGGGVGETDVKDHEGTVRDLCLTLTGKGGKQFPRCSQPVHRERDRFPDRIYLLPGCLLALTPMGACGQGVVPGAHFLGCLARTASTCFTSH